MRSVTCGRSPRTVSSKACFTTRTSVPPAATATARRLAAEEGIFSGISGGATVATALEVAATAPAGSVILGMLPDTGERYLSTFLFEGVSEGSDDEWLAAL